MKLPLNRLKGVKPASESRVVQRARDLVDLGEPDKDKPSAALSGSFAVVVSLHLPGAHVTHCAGGMRRRLSLAMALIGDPEVCRCNR